MRKGRGLAANEVAEVRIVESKGECNIPGIIIVYYHSTIYIL